MKCCLFQYIWYYHDSYAHWKIQLMLFHKSAQVIWRVHTRSKNTLPAIFKNIKEQHKLVTMLHVILTLLCQPNIISSITKTTIQTRQRIYNKKAEILTRCKCFALYKESDLYLDMKVRTGKS